MASKTKIIKKHLDNVARIGCMVCRSPFVHLHHIRPKNTGMGRRTSDWCVIPLCQEHHQGNTGIHHNKTKFENKHGKEIDGISGATISVKSFTKGISKLSLLLPYIINK